MADTERDAANILAEARAAWRALADAEANIHRLDRYRSPNRLMVEDKIKSVQQAADARVELARLLGRSP